MCPDPRLEVHQVPVYAKIGVPVGWDLCVGCELRSRDCPWHSEAWKHIGHLEGTMVEAVFLNGIGTFLNGMDS